MNHLLLAILFAAGPLSLTDDVFHHIEMADGRTVEAVRLSDPSWTTAPLLLWRESGGPLRVEVDGELASGTIQGPLPSNATAEMPGMLRVVWRQMSAGWKLREPGRVQRASLSDRRAGDLELRYVLVAVGQGASAAVAWRIQRDGRDVDQGHAVFDSVSGREQAVRARARDDAFPIRFVLGGAPAGR